MKDWKKEIDEALKDFVKVSEIARMPMAFEDFEVEYSHLPHTPPMRLPENKMAIYGFCFQGNWLKIGKVGPKSQARYTYQHYSPNSSRSNLAKSLLRETEMKALVKDNVGEWIKNNCNRVNILIDIEHGLLLLSLLEAFLHARLKPKYELTGKTPDEDRG
jgi:hypothetical protein